MPVLHYHESVFHVTELITKTALISILSDSTQDTSRLIVREFNFVNSYLQVNNV